jgi:hypothetical protein
VPRHVARLVTRLVAPLVIDYTASRRLVGDYFTFVARPGASARRVARRATRRRLLRLHRASGCLGTLHGSSRLIAPLVDDFSASRRLVVDYSASRRLVVDYFASAALLGASARRAARHAARRAARR